MDFRDADVRSQVHQGFIEVSRPIRQSGFHKALYFLPAPAFQDVFFHLVKPGIDPKHVAIYGAFLFP